MKIIKQNISNMVMKNSYEYAQYTLLNKVIPYIDDGLLPVHRALLTAVYKEAKDGYIGGLQAIGGAQKMHVHGDRSISKALATMVAQQASLFKTDGVASTSVTGIPTAPRYYKVGISEFGKALLKDTVVSGDIEQPFKFRIPYGLMLEQTCIGSGLAVKYPAFNPNEIMDALLALARNPKILNSELAEIIQGLDNCGGKITQPENAVETLLESGAVKDIVALCRIQKAPITRESKAHEIQILDLPWQSRPGKLLTSKEWEKFPDLDIKQVRNVSSAGASEIRIPFKNSRTTIAEIRNKLYASGLGFKKGLSVKLLYINKDGLVDIFPLRGILEDSIKYNMDFILSTIEEEIARLIKLNELYLALELLTREENIDTFLGFLKLKTKKQLTLEKWQELSQSQVDMVFSNNNLNKLSDRDEILKELESFAGRIAEQEKRKSAKNLRKETIAYFEMLKGLIGETPRKTEVIKVPEGFSNKEEVQELASSEEVFLCITHDNKIRQVNGAEMELEDELNLKYLVWTTSDAKVGFLFRKKILSIKVENIPYEPVDINQLMETEEEFMCPIKDIMESYMFIYSSGKVKKVSGSDFNFRKSKREGFKFMENERIIGVAPSSSYEDFDYLYLLSKGGRIKRLDITTLRPMGIESFGRIITSLPAGDEIIDWIFSSEDTIEMVNSQGETATFTYDHEIMETESRNQPYRAFEEYVMFSDGFVSGEDFAPDTAGTLAIIDERVKKFSHTC